MFSVKKFHHINGKKVEGKKAYSKEEMRDMKMREQQQGTTIIHFFLQSGIFFFKRIFFLTYFPFQILTDFQGIPSEVIFSSYNTHGPVWWAK